MFDDRLYEYAKAHHRPVFETIIHLDKRITEYRHMRRLLLIDLAKMLRAEQIANLPVDKAE